MKRSRELRCPDCGNTIFIYDKETFCYCKKCKKDYQVIKEKDQFSLVPAIVKNKNSSFYTSNTIKFFLIIFILIILFGFILYFYYSKNISDNDVINNNGDVPITNR